MLMSNSVQLLEPSSVFYDSSLDSKDQLMMSTLSSMSHLEPLITFESASSMCNDHDGLSPVTDHCDGLHQFDNAISNCSPHQNDNQCHNLVDGKSIYVLLKS